MKNIDTYSNFAWDFILTYGPRLIAAILTLFIGLWVVKILTRIINNLLHKKEIDPSLTPFLKGLFSGVLKLLLIVTVLGMLGVEMTSFIAIIGSMGLAIGLALSGSLQNFAGGIIILIFKPFKVGDFIQADSFSGVVHEISIMHTVLKTVNNQTITMPNGNLSNNNITNFSTEQTRRADWVFGVAYGDDAEKTKLVLENLIAQEKRILAEPAPFIALNDLSDSSVNFVVRAWTKTADYWDVYFKMNENVYKAFTEEGLSIPFPQMDVHLHQADAQNNTH